jgi:hypothetical protein
MWKIIAIIILVGIVANWFARTRVRDRHLDG